MGKLSDVNTTDIRDSIRLGCQNMSSVFNADDNDVPFFGSVLLPEARLTFSRRHSEAHVPGRHLNALLSAEAIAGIELDEEAIAKHARAAFFSYSGAVALPLNREEPGGGLVNFSPHNVREGFHALYSLIRFRGSGRARHVADKSVESIFELWDPDKGWNETEIVKRYNLNFLEPNSFVSGLARALGPLIKLFKTTGSGHFLELAILIKDRLIKEYYKDDGAYDRKILGTHCHSVTCVLSSLAQMADLLSDSLLMQRVKSFYDKGLWDLRDYIGWSVESTSPKKFDPDRGESNNTGDILETALILGRWGHPTCYEDAEKILRCHLLPSQLRDVSFVREPANEDSVDGIRDVGRRHIGAFGFPAPYGHKRTGSENVGFNMDIVGGAVASLCEAYRELYHKDESGYRVELHFDADDDDRSVESPYTHSAMWVLVKKPAPLWIRIPSWADTARLVVSSDADPRPSYLTSGGYLLFTDPPLNQWITIGLVLAEREIVLRHVTHDIRAQLRGDEVTAMDNFGQDLTFFDPSG